MTGLLLYALQLLPNIIWLAMPPANDVLKHNSSPHASLNLVEQVFGIATVALLIIVITRAGTEGRNSSLAADLRSRLLGGVLRSLGPLLPRQCLVLASGGRHRRYAAPVLLLRGWLDEGLLCARSLRDLRHSPRRDHVVELPRARRSLCLAFARFSSRYETFSSTFPHF